MEGHVYLWIPRHCVRPPHSFLSHTYLLFCTCKLTNRLHRLEFVIWFVPSLVGDAIAASFVGFLLGPMHPIIMTQTSRILPRETLTASIGWITGFGFAGSAFFPFITGAIASKHGIKSLQPLSVFLSFFLVGISY